MPEMKTLTIKGTTYEIVDAKARASIENIPSSEGSTTSVSYEAQELTDEQKIQARANINAISADETDTKISDAFESIPQPITGTITQSQDTVIAVSLNLTDGYNTTSIVTFDNGYPTRIDTDGSVLTLTWEGFAETSTVSEEDVEVTSSE